jgi:UDP-N-acetylglucosamine 2-epimerase (non-hydrolysing)
MKIAPIWEEIQAYNGQGREPRFEPILVHTGQHYDHAMSQSFFDDLQLPRPDINLGVGSGSHAEQTSKVMTAFEGLLEREHPDLVLVVGDVNSTMACTIAAKKLNIAVAHVEAGLRSGDMTMPEEINRKVTDFIADYLFTTDPIADANLRGEGIPDHRIFFVGNVMIDTLLKHRVRASTSPVLEKLCLKNGAGVRPYGVVTLHRPSNVDHPETLREICRALEAIAETLHLVFPCHPRTEERVRSFGLSALFGGSVLKGKGIALIPPLGYLDFLQLHANAKIILTDSGGIQEEATILGVPCLTLRENTERPITITRGTNRLVGTRLEAILEGFQTALGENGRSMQQPERWDGRAAERIVGILAKIAKGGENGMAPVDQQLPPGSGPVRVGYEKVTLSDLAR